MNTRVKNDTPAPIEDYALLGDMRTAVSPVLTVHRLPALSGSTFSGMETSCLYGLERSCQPASRRLP
jgi:hypothetical protein